MSPGHRKCCVLNCEINVKVLPMHRFPNPKKDVDRLRKWVKALNNQDLFNMDVIDVYDSKRVCHRHFESRYYPEGIPSPRLYSNAIPSLYLSKNEAPDSGSADSSSANDAAEKQVEYTEQDIMAGSSQSSHQTDAFVKSVHIDATKKLEEETEAITATPDPTVKRFGIRVRKDLIRKKKVYYAVVKCIWRK